MYILKQLFFSISVNSGRIFTLISMNNIVNYFLYETKNQIPKDRNLVQNVFCFFARLQRIRATHV